MPEFHESEEQHQAWKRSVLGGDIELDDIDTDPFNLTSRLLPTKAPSDEAAAAKQAIDERAAAVGS